MYSAAQLRTSLRLHREFIFLIYKHRLSESYIQELNFKGFQDLCFGRDKFFVKHKFEYKYTFRYG
jgi:hypothetical protein